MNSELEEYLTYIMDAIGHLRDVVKGLDGAALVNVPAGAERSAGWYVLMACARIRAVLEKQVIEAAPVTPSDLEVPEPTPDSLEEGIQATVAFIDWHKARITEAMLGETRTVERGGKPVEMTVRRILYELLLNTGRAAGAAAALGRVTR